MKKLFLSIMFCFCLVTFAQESGGATTKAGEYINFLQSISQNVSASKTDFEGKISPKILESRTSRDLVHLKVLENVNSFSDDEIIKLAKLKADAYEENPFKLTRMIVENDIRLEKIPKNKNVNEIKLGLPNRFIDERLAKIRPAIMADLLPIPFIFVVKVKNIVETTKVLDGDDKGPQLKMAKISVNVIIEEIIKGEKLYSVGDELEFYFMQWWNKTGQDFIEGERYFVSLRARIELEGDDRDNYTSLKLFNEGNDGIFHIEKNIINDLNNCFGFGTQTSWEGFKEKFQSKYIIN